MSKKKTTPRKKAAVEPTPAPNLKTSKTPPVKLKELYVQKPVYVSINVSDLGRARKFYTEVLEFEGGDHYEEAGWSEIKLPVPNVRLGLNKDRNGRVEPGTTFINLSVKDLEIFRDSLIAKGVKPGEINDIPKMVSLFAVKDPDGNEIDFVTDPRVT